MLPTGEVRMKGTRYERLTIMRAIILMGVLLVVSWSIAFARPGTHLLWPPLGLQDTSPPYVSLDPDGLDFGDQVAGRWSPAYRINVTNTGGQPLYVDSVAVVAGENSRNFNIVKDTCTGVKVPPYRACIIDIAFGPSKTGGFDAELKLTGNAIASPHLMRLEGNGINSINASPFGAD
jgi:hypothetical protein